MSRTLVVCDNEFLKTLYVINLEVYLATAVVCCASAEEAIATHRAKKNFDLIISLEIVGKKNATKEIQDYRSSYGVKTPFLVIGGEKEGEIDARTFGVLSRYNLQGILKRAAAILGVTAKQMAEMTMGAYYPLSLESAEVLAVAPCPIYTETEPSVHKLLVRTGDSVDPSFKDLKGKGGDKIYVKSTDRLVFINNISLRLIEKITVALNNSEGETVEKKVEILSDGYEFAAATLFSNEDIRQEMQEIASASAKVMSDVVREKSQLRGLLETMMSNKSGYIFTHSMITSYVAQHIIKNVTWGGKGQSEKINFVLFFHDIYLAPIYLKHPQLQFEKNLLDSQALSDREKEVVMDHARMAAELVVSYKKCPMGADLLIKHHHGVQRGSGFAQKYPEDLSPISKVLLIAEAFTEEFMMYANRNQKPEVTAIVARLSAEFPLPSYLKIIQTLPTIAL